MKIMLLEDDVALNGTICEVLKTIERCDVDTYYDGESAAKSLNNIYDLYIIDLNVPNLNGIDFLKLLKAHDINTPALIISADTDIQTITQAYNIGCNDFLKKPFYVEELLFKVKQYVKDFHTVDLGDGLRYDLYKRVLNQGDKELHMTKKEKDLLHLLILNQGEIVSNDMIQSFVYNNEYVSNDSQRALIKRVRKIIGKDKIVNITSQGYKIEK